MDLEMVKEIPGYKIILKAVLKSQIQQLVDYLSSFTEEESVLLTANVSDGSLSQLGSGSGKVFLQDREELKSEFLGFCLKRHMEGLKMEKQQKFTLGQQSHGNSLPKQTKMTTGISKGVRHKPYPSSKPKSSLESTKTQPQVEIDSDDTQQNDNEDSYSHEIVAVKEEVDDQSYLMNTDSETFTDGNFDDTAGDGEEGYTNEIGVQAEEDSSEYGTISTSWQPTPTWKEPKPAATRLFDEKTQKFGFPCDFCDKIFGANCDLVRHRMIHTGEKPYPCPVCLKRFRQKAHRRGHMARHHPKVVLANTEPLFQGYDLGLQDVDNWAATPDND